MQQNDFGYLCSYFPVELAMAAGYHPVRLLPAGPAPAGGLLPSFLCAPVRHYLTCALNGEYRHLAGVGITHACDAMQSLAQVWQATVKEPPLFLLHFPTRRDAAALAHLTAAMRDLGARLPAIADATALAGAVSRARARRRQLHHLLEHRAALDPATVWNLLTAPWCDNEQRPKPDRLQAPGQEHIPADGGTVRIVLSGSILSSPRLLEIVRESGGVVVGDDLCSGERGLGPLPPAEEGDSVPGDDPWTVLARQYLDMPPCPCRHPSLEERVQHLLRLARVRHAQGVILLREKFCEPHRWENHAVSAGLRGHGIPVLELETEGGTVGGERELTRLQAFLEMVGAEHGAGAP